MLLDDGPDEPATRETVDRWGSTFRTSVDVAAVSRDKYIGAGGGALAVPTIYVIDTKTMRIVRVGSGEYAPSRIPDSALRALGLPSPPSS